MKYYKILLIILFFFPFITMAEECDMSKITITSVAQKSIEGNTKVISEPTFKDRNINLDLKMYEVGDSVTYDMIIKNESEEDYMIDENTFKTDSDYIEYTLKTNDDSNVVKAKSSKDLTLIVEYKKEVEKDKLTNNRFNASNNLKLSLNTNTNEQPLDVITTDNIKESDAPKMVNNPVTSVKNNKLIIIFLITVVTIIILTKYNKKKYNKYMVILLSILLIPTVYAICKVDIEVESIIEIEKLPKLYDTIAQLSSEDNACVTKYDGEVTDQVGQTVTASNVYFDNCIDKRNVMFGGFCWQVIRTTETKGTKMMYNGEPIDGKCQSNRNDQTGIVENNTTSVNLNNNYKYASAFKYNKEDNSFELLNSFDSTWGNDTYEMLLGKFTCLSDNIKCETIYEVNDYVDDEKAKVLSYSLSPTNYSQIGRSSIGSSTNSPAFFGYMYNDTYKILYEDNLFWNSYYKYSSDYTYNEATKKYTLDGEIKSYRIGSSGMDDASDFPYTCMSTNSSCDSLVYIIFQWQPYTIYVRLTNGESQLDVLEKTLFSSNVNKYNSNIKGILESWYEQNLLDFDDKIEKNVYCNSREISVKNGWGSIVRRSNLICNNSTDQFSVNNQTAKLKYSIGLSTYSEMFNLSDNSLRKTNNIFLTMSPGFISEDYMYMNTIDAQGRLSSTFSGGLRPMISIKEENVIKSGSGSETDPWIIE